MWSLLQVKFYWNIEVPEDVELTISKVVRVCKYVYMI